MQGERRCIQAQSGRPGVLASAGNTITYGMQMSLLRCAACSCTRALCIRLFIASGRRFPDSSDGLPFRGGFLDLLAV